MPWLSWFRLSVLAITAFLFESAMALSFFPLAVPLAVKTPYLNSWLPGGTDASPISRQWSYNGYGHTITGWAGLARVDGVTYAFHGAAAAGGRFIGLRGEQRAMQITATQSQFLVRCGGVDLNVTFLSPIEPMDFMRMSLPFSYMSVVATPNDNRGHSVQIYSDVSGEWLTNDANAAMTWETQRTSGIVYHRFSLQSPVQYGQTNGRVSYGHGYHGILYDDDVTYQTMDDVSLRTWFNTTGSMNNTQDDSFRAINSAWPCMALAKDLGNIAETSDPVVFALGLSRDPAVSYQMTTGAQPRSLYYHTQFGTDQDALSFFLNDYNHALSSAVEFDQRVAAAGSQISTAYANVITMAARQTFASVEITVSTGSDGQLNSSDILAFMGIDGINRIESIYASAPFWIWSNPSIIRILIEPIIQWHRRVAGTSSAVPYVIGDIGDTYPQAIGPITALTNPKSLESTADMMIVTAALVRATGDASVVAQNADLYNIWGEFLKTNIQSPASQGTTDGTVIGDPNNDSNLAAKAIIALKAYGDLLASIDRDGTAYSDTAANYATSWLSSAVSPSGIQSDYGTSDTWTMAPNLFADKWLKANVFPDDLYQAIGSFYLLHLDTFGIPLNSDTTITSAQSMLFAAGLVPDTVTRDALVEKVEHYLESGPDHRPWSTLFHANNGSTAADSANGPKVGGVFSLLARDLAVVEHPSTTPSDAPSIAHSISFYLSTGSYLVALFIIALSYEL